MDLVYRGSSPLFPNISHYSITSVCSFFLNNSPRYWIFLIFANRWPRLRTMLALFVSFGLLRFFLLIENTHTCRAKFRIFIYKLDARKIRKFKAISSKTRSFFISHAAQRMLFAKIGFSNLLLETSQQLICVDNSSTASQGGRLIGLLWI